MVETAIHQAGTGLVPGYLHITVAPVSGVLGAEVAGADLADELDDAVVEEIHRAFLDHHVLFFHDQELSAEEQMAFGRRFGTLGTHPFVTGRSDYPEVIEIVTEPDDRVNFGGGWHTDVTFLEEPDLGSILYAIEVPPYGGDTLFADQQAAYEALPEETKARIDGLVALHSPSAQYGAGGYSTLSRSVTTTNAAATGEVVRHPVVRTHPETGRKGLYVNRAFTIGIEGAAPDEAGRLLEELFVHATREAFTCRFRWRPGSLAMWDNRCVQHYALYDYKGQRRHMRRITIRGDRPR